MTILVEISSLAPNDYSTNWSVNPAAQENPEIKTGRHFK
jgi:hypothetical protein